MKIYNKRGNLNYKERRLVAQITEAVEKKLIENPSLEITPANTSAELEKLYNEHCTEYVEFQEVQEIPETSEPNPTENDHKNFRDNLAENITKTEGTGGENVVDPFNRDEAIVRDYVKQSDFPGDKSNSTGSKTYGEPQTSFDQMAMPPTEEEQLKAKANDPGSSNQPKNNATTNNNTTTNTTTNTGGETDAQKTKRSKKFAKTIVLLITGLYQKGVIWWSTKDINEAKLQEHSAKGELDLLEQLSLTEDQDIAVKDFFSMQCQAINQAVIVTQEEKERLTDSLTELLIEKKIAPSNTQMLLFDVVEVFGLKTIAVYQVAEQSKALLEQLIIKAKRENELYANETGTEKNFNAIDQNANHNTSETNKTTTKNDVEETIKTPTETNLVVITGN
jgi:hypothetical protein